MVSVISTGYTGVQYQYIINVHLILQIHSLRRLEYENEEAAKRLEDVVERGERLLSQIQDALHDIAQSQLDTQ